MPLVNLFTKSTFFQTLHLTDLKLFQDSLANTRILCVKQVFCEELNSHI